MTILQSEWLKTKRTPLRPLAVGLPLLYAALILWYFSRWDITPERQLSLFLAFFEGWTVLMIPVGIGVAAGYMAHQEEEAGHFRGILGSPRPRSHLFSGKLIILLLLISVATLAATTFLILGFKLVMDVLIAWPIFLLATLMALVGSMPLLILHYWIGYVWGYGPSVGIGGAGLLIAALTATSIGDTVWPFIPWAWPVRLALLPGAYLAYLPGMDSPPELIASGEILHQTFQGLIASTLTFFILLTGAILWFNRWEGRKGEH